MKHIDAFSGIHPTVEFMYFAYALCVSMLCMHPVVLIISFIASLSYAIYLNGIKTVRLALFAVLPIMLLSIIINALFNGSGKTVLFYLYNPVTLEACIYGAVSALMFGSVILIFSCYNAVLTTDKFLYLFGRIIPKTALLISMSLRFIPHFTRKLREVASARESMGEGIRSGNIIKRIRYGLKIFRITTALVFEKAIITADSMKSRGYGKRKRTSFSIYRFDMRDAIILLALILTGSMFIYGKIAGSIKISYYPVIQTSNFTLASIIGICSFAFFCFTPLIFDLTEDLKWHYLQSKI